MIKSAKEQFVDSVLSIWSDYEFDIAHTTIAHQYQLRQLFELGFDYGTKHAKNTAEIQAQKACDRIINTYYKDQIKLAKKLKELEDE